MTGEAWDAVDQALDEAAEAGRTVEVWLRDDDAVAATPALDRLADLCETHAMPVLLAVIPARAEPSLPRFLAAHSTLIPAQHGYSHANHAAPGERARELGGGRPLAEVIGDLARGRDRLTDLFGGTPGDILVPPWNRIDPALLPALPALGFGALSAFGSSGPTIPGLDQVNSTLDIIDWRNGRVGHSPAKLAGKLAALIAQPASIGLLTHHLAHDEAAWTGLRDCLTRLDRHATVRFTSFDAIRRSPSNAAQSLR